MLKPDERIRKLVGDWTGSSYLVHHDELVNLIREVERDTLKRAIKEVEAAWDYPYAQCISELLEE